MPICESPAEECSASYLSDNSYEEEYSYEDSGDGQIDVITNSEEDAMESSNDTKRYTFVPQKSLLDRILNQSRNLASLLSITEGQAVALLVYSGWNESRLHDKW